MLIVPVSGHVCRTACDSLRMNTQVRPAPGKAWESPWTIVDQRFYPDATALTDVEQDVVSPWTRPTTLSFSGRVVKRAVRTLAVATTLDGQMTAIVRTSAARVRAELVVGGRVVSAGTGRAVTLSTTVCGSRSATVRIRNAAKATRYTVSVARP